MTFSEDVLRYDERAVFRLRTLYKQYGYSPYRMRRFEQYELYAENKAFLQSGDIITFTGPGGQLMAMRPDVTLSIVKSARGGSEISKLYYNENVYRPEGPQREFRERMQAGLECLGNIGVSETAEVIMLAERSLSALGKNTCLDISHMGFLGAMLEHAELSDSDSARILRLIGSKNVPGLSAACMELSVSADFRERIISLCSLYGPIGSTLEKLSHISVSEKTDAAAGELADIYAALKALDAHRNVNLDFSIVNDMNYYSGIIFQGFIEGIPVKVLSGGRYDKLFEKFGKCSGAIGFAVYLDLLERLEETAL